METSKTVRDPYLPRLCPNCGTPLKTLKSATSFSIGDAKYGKSRKFCSTNCASEHYKDTYEERNPGRGRLPKATIGAISELVIASDLLMKGYAVFRSLSPSCPCDLAILKGKELIRVEVTTGSISRKGKVSYPGKDPEKFDVLAVYIPSRREILYEPDLPQVK